MTDKGSDFWHLLYVEDDQEDFLLFKSMLANSGKKNLQIDWAETDQIGREKIRSKQYDAVLVDYDLGFETGIDIIREFHATYPAPFILFTGHDTPEFDQQAQQAGATLFLTKGEANPRLLERVIRYAIERKQAALSLSQVQDQLSQMFELSPDAVLVQKRGKYAYANSAALKLYKAKSLDQIIDHRITEFVHPEDRQMVIKRMQYVTKARKPVERTEVRLRALDGSTILTESAATPIIYEDELAALVILRDITERNVFEQVLSQSEQRFHALITAFTEVVYRMSPDWKEMKQLQGGNFLTSVESDNAKWMDGYIPAEDRAFVMERIQNSIQNQSIFNLEHRVITADGSIGWVLSRAVPIRNEKGELIEWFGAASNITDRKRAEEETSIDLNFTQLLVEIGQRMVSEDSLHHIFEDILDAAIRFTQADAGVVQILNPDREDLNVLASKNLDDTILPFFNHITKDQKTPSGIAMDTRDRVVMNYQDQIGQKADDLFRTRIEAGFTSGQTTPLITRSGKLIGMISTLWKGECKTKERAWHFLDLLTRQAADLFERIQTQSELRESEHRFRMVADETPLLIFFIDSKGVIQFINKTFSWFFGIELKYMSHDKWENLILPKDLDYFTRETSDLIKSKQFGKIKLRVRHRSGEWRWVESYWQPRFSEQGVYIGMAGTAVDIHEQILAEEKVRHNSKKLERTIQALQESEVRFRTIADETPLHIAVLDQNGRLEFINKAHRDYFGFSLGDLQNLGWQDLVHPQDRKRYSRFLREINQNQKSGSNQIRVLRKDGCWRWIESVWQPRFSEKMEFMGMAGSSLDVHDQITAEKNQRRYAEELEHINQALRESEQRFRAMADATPVLIFVVDETGKMEFINRAYTEFMGVTIEEIQSHDWDYLIHPDDQAEYIRIFQECLKEKKPGKARARVMNKDLGWRWVEAHWGPRYSDEGQFNGMAGSAIDVHDQILAKENRLRYAQELERSNQALREFTSIASHDLQEPLRKITAFGKILEKSTGGKLDDEAKGYLDRILQAGDRMQKMINGLLQYARVSSRDLTPSIVNLNNIVSEVLNDLEIRIHETGAKIEVAELPAIHADALQMTQLFQNLILNAIKFQKPGETPFIKISGVPVNHDAVEISVEDNGIGFEMKHADLIFEPFTRLHRRSEYQGTGMGLSLCKKIIDRHNGTIKAVSEPGKGSVFKLTLPR